MHEPKLGQVAEVGREGACCALAAAPSYEGLNLGQTEDGLLSGALCASVTASLGHLPGCEPDAELPAGDVAFHVAPPRQGNLLRWNGPVATSDGLLEVTRDLLPFAPARCRRSLLGPL